MNGAFIEEFRASTTGSLTRLGNSYKNKLTALSKGVLNLNISLFMKSFHESSA